MNESIVVLPNLEVTLANAKNFLDYYFHEGKLGGMLIPDETTIDLGREVNVQIFFKEENRQFNIRGVTRWKRLNHQPNLPRGTGDIDTGAAKLSVIGRSCRPTANSCR